MSNKYSDHKNVSIFFLNSYNNYDDKNSNIDNNNNIFTISQH